MKQEAEPRELGRYRLLTLLGEGGMGEVHLATAQGTAGFEKIVALKVLSATHCDDPGRVRSLQREALIGVRLDHQNVVQVLDFGEHEGSYYIAMEYVRGFTLEDVLGHARTQNRHLPLQPMIHIVRTMTDALSYIHSLVDGNGDPLALIHGDISPSNILLAADGRIKLADFGIAALAGELTTGAVAGKPRYLPPEALRGDEHSQARDVYALGAVLYETIAGHPAHPGTTLSEVAASMQAGATPVRTLRPDCPEALAMVAERCIAQEPSARLATAADLRRALDDAFPRQVDDADAHRSFVIELFGQEEFVRSHGELPTTGPFRHTDDLVPHITAQADQDDITLAPRRLPALRFGMSPALSSDVARRHGERFARLLEQRLDRGVRTMVFADYDTLIDCLSRGEVDLAWTPPFTFLEAMDRGAGLLVMAQRSGITAFEAAVIVGANTGLKELGDLRNQSMAWVDRNSASGFVYAAAEIIRRLGPLDEVLGRQHFHGSHKMVCEAVANGWASAGSTYAIRNAQGRLVASGWLDLIPARADELRALTFIGPIPADSLAHRPQLPSGVIEQLVNVLTRLGADAEGRAVIRDIFGAEEFVPGNLDSYDAVRDAIRLVRDR